MVKYLIISKYNPYSKYFETFGISNEIKNFLMFLTDSKIEYKFLTTETHSSKKIININRKFLDNKKLLNFVKLLFSYHPFLDDIFFSLNACSKIKELLKKDNFDNIIFISDNADFVTGFPIFLLKNIKSKKVLLNFGGGPFIDKKSYKLRREVLKNFDYIFCANKQKKKEYKKMNILAQILPTTIPLGHLKSFRKQKRRSKKTIFTYFGRLGKEKGTYNLKKFLEYLDKIEFNYEFWSFVKKMIYMFL